MSMPFSHAITVPAKPFVKPFSRPQRNWPFLSSAFPCNAFSSTVAVRTVDGGSKPKALPPELETDGEDGLALPVEPDEGTVLIPDDERVINVPS